MKENFYTQFNESAMQFVTDFLTKNCEAYFEYSGQLFETSDARLDEDYYIYASPYQQIVYDSSISGITIPTGISSSVGNLNRASGIIFDFNNGRVLSEVELSGVEAVFTAREINFYKTNENQEKLILESKYINNGDFENFNASGGATPYDYVMPCVIFSSDDFNSEPYSLGGEEQTKFLCKLLVVSDNVFEIDSIVGAAHTAKGRSFASLTREELPLNQLGDLKTGYYFADWDRNKDYYISKVYVRKMKDYATKSLPSAMYVAFIDLHIEKVHFLRA